MGRANFLNGRSPFAMPKAGDIMDRLVLELDTPAAVEDRIAKGNILSPIEWFEYLVG